VDDTPVFRKLFNYWDLLNVDEHYKEVNEPICVFTWTKQESTTEPVLKYTSGELSMKFKGLVNGTPVCILIDTGALGTAFIYRNHYKGESISLRPSPPGLFIVLGDISKVPATDMATVTIEMGTYEACQTLLLTLKLRKPRKRLDRQERSDIRQDNNRQERATINQTLVQFLQRLVADRIGSQGTRVHPASGDHKVRETGVLTQLDF
jgi:hypothetical protein